MERGGIRGFRRTERPRISFHFIRATLAELSPAPQGAERNIQLCDVSFGEIALMSLARQERPLGVVRRLIRVSVRQPAARG